MNSDDQDYYCMLTLMQDRQAMGVTAYTFVRDAVAKYHHLSYKDLEEMYRDKAK